MEIMLTNTEIITRLVIALLLGVALGVERAVAGKVAGMRTYSLVSMGSALFVIISIVVGEYYIGRTSFDPLRMASQIVVGIGFLGAGLIIFRGDHISGLTTAAGLWVAAGIGVAVGYGLYQIAIAVTLITFFIFSVLWYIEQKVKKFRKKSHQETDAQDS